MYGQFVCENLSQGAQRHGRIQGYSLVFLGIPNFFEILLCIYVYILVYIYVYCNIMYCFRSLQPESVKNTAFQPCLQTSSFPGRPTRPTQALHPFLPSLWPTPSPRHPLGPRPLLARTRDTDGTRWTPRGEERAAAGGARLAWPAQAARAQGSKSQWQGAGRAAGARGRGAGLQGAPRRRPGQPATSSPQPLARCPGLRTAGL